MFLMVISSVVLLSWQCVGLGSEGGVSEERLKKVTLLIPLTLNDGSAVPEEGIDSICDRLYELCGGITTGETVEGAYRMASGQKQVEKNLLIWVWAAPTELDRLRNLVRQFGRELGQESMYFEISDSEVEFIS
jgi:hypothetical protein